MTGFREARDFLLQNRTDLDAATAGFRWPDPVSFNWALDWFDAELAANPENRDRAALRIVDSASGARDELTFGELSERSNQVANWLLALGARRGARLLLLLGNVVPLWEVMLAATKLGLVVIPATTLLSRDELADRLERGGATIVVAAADQTAKFEDFAPEGLTRIVVGGLANGWIPFEEARNAEVRFEPQEETGADEPLLLYFTSGTTAKPKLVMHTHRSYPVGALSTMYWTGLQPGDVHLNISSPGWAKHAWSSLFAPWNAGATILAVNQPRFDARALLGVVSGEKATTLCAPPTVWRMLIQEDLTRYPVALREIVGAGEPLNPEVIERVEAAWGVTIRDGFGQSETTAMIGNAPGQPVAPGAVGRALPGWTVALVAPDDEPAEEGEIEVQWAGEPPAGLMTGYLQADGSTAGVGQNRYRTGDIASRGVDGSLTFVGRADDVFKSADYRISPFELESALLEHEAVAEAAIVPAPDPLRLAVPKAYVMLAAGHAPDARTARSVLEHCAARLSPFKRVRAVSFVSELPKTVSGKIRRVELRRAEAAGAATIPPEFVVATFREEDLRA